MEFTVGMKVVHEDSYDNKRITYVTTITPKGFIKVYYCKEHFFNPDGTERSSDIWHKQHIRPATQEDLDAAEKSRLARRASDFNWRLLSLEKLREIDQLITLTNAAAAIKEKINDH